MSENLLNRNKTRFLIEKKTDEPSENRTEIESDDEGMIEEIITTVEEDKDLECKIKKKIETKRTFGEDPSTHNRITKVIKTEVTEITRTITINDENDLERAKRELGLDDVNRLLPSGHRSRSNENFNDEEKKCHEENFRENEEKPIYAEATTVGRGPVVDEPKFERVQDPKIPEPKRKNKKKKSKFCSCARSSNDEKEISEKPTENISIKTEPKIFVPSDQMENFGRKLISDEAKILIDRRKNSLIELFHENELKNFEFSSTNDENRKRRKISSRIFDLLRYDRCSSWEQLEEQILDENEQTDWIKNVLPPIVKFHKNFFEKNSFDVPRNETKIDEKQFSLAEAFAFRLVDFKEKNFLLDDENRNFFEKIFLPIEKENLTNFIRIERDEKTLAEIQLDEPNSFEKFSQIEPNLNVFQSAFLPIDEFNEKNFKKITEKILEQKSNFDRIRFQLSRISLTNEDFKETTNNDFSQSDSGYSMTTNTFESFHSKIKIEFEPIPQQSSIVENSDSSLDQRRIDLDNLDQEQIQKFKLDQDFIRIIKQDFNQDKKTVGEAILSGELKLKPENDEDQKNLEKFSLDENRREIGEKLFFPRESLTICFSPSAGRFVELQTKSVEQNDPTFSQIEPKKIEEKILKKRKSPISTGFFSCLSKKKIKSDEQNEPIVETKIEEKIEKIEKNETPIFREIFLNAEGKRIYIDEFRPRPGLDMSYRPENFDHRFVLPESKNSVQIEGSLTPETESTFFRSEMTEEKSPPTPEKLEENFQIETRKNVEFLPKIERPELRPPSLDLPKIEPDNFPRFSTGKTSKNFSLFCFRQKPKKNKIKKFSTGAPIERIPSKSNENDVENQQIEKNFDEEKTEKTTNDEEKFFSIFSGVNIDTFRERTFNEKFVEKQKKSTKEEKIEILPEKLEETKIFVAAEQILPGGKINIDNFRERNYSEKFLEKPKETTKKENLPAKLEEKQISIDENRSFSREKIQIDNFRERNFDKKFVEKEKKKSTEPTKTENFEPKIEEKENLTVAKEILPREKINIDNFRERTFNEKFVEKEKKNSTKEENQVENSSPKVEEKTNFNVENENLPREKVNIDTFRERNFDNVFRSVENSRKIEDEQKPEEVKAPIDLASIYSRVNIDTFRERNFRNQQEKVESLTTDEENNAQLETILDATEILDEYSSRNEKEEISIFSDLNDDRTEKEFLEENLQTETEKTQTVEEEENSENELRTDRTEQEENSEVQIIADRTGQEEENSEIELLTDGTEQEEISEAQIIAGQTEQEENSETQIIAGQTEQEEEQNPEVQIVADRTEQEEENSEVQIIADRTGQEEEQNPEVQIIADQTAEEENSEIEPRADRTEHEEENSAIENGKSQTTEEEENLEVQIVTDQTEPEEENLELQKEKSENEENCEVYREETEIERVENETVRTQLAEENVEFQDEKLETSHEEEISVLKIDKTRSDSTEKVQSETKEEKSIYPQGKSSNGSDSILSRVNIDNFRQRIFTEVFKSSSTKQKREKNDFQSSNFDEKEILKISQVESDGKSKNEENSSIFQRINIDNFRDRIFEVKKEKVFVEKIPVEQEKTEKILEKNEIETNLARKTSIENFNEPMKIENLTKKTGQKTSVFSNVFRSNGAGLDLPSVEQSLARREFSVDFKEKIDPFRVPSVVLPSPKILLPKIDRPEAKLVEEQRSISEFHVPLIEPISIENLQNFSTRKKENFGQNNSSTRKLFSCFGHKSSKKSEKNFCSSLKAAPVEIPAIDLENSICLEAHRINKNQNRSTNFFIFDDPKIRERKTKFQQIFIEQFSNDEKQRKSNENFFQRGIDAVQRENFQDFPNLKTKLEEKNKKQKNVVGPFVRALQLLVEQQNLDDDQFDDALRQALRDDQNRNVTTNDRESAKISLVEENRRSQLNSHRTELVELISSEFENCEEKFVKIPSNRREKEKLVQKTLNFVVKKNLNSFDEIREKLKTEEKNIFYLVDPIVEIVRNSLNQIDLTKINEKTTVDIVRSQINETTRNFNRQKTLFDNEQTKNFSWIPDFLLEQNRSTNKEKKQLRKILTRAIQIVSLDVCSNWEQIEEQLDREFTKKKIFVQKSIELLKNAQKSGVFRFQRRPTSNEFQFRRNSNFLNEKSRNNLKTNKILIVQSIKNLFQQENQEKVEQILGKTFDFLEQENDDDLKNFDDLKTKLKKNFDGQEENLIEKVVDLVEQAHVADQFEQIDKPTVQNLLKDRLDGKPLIIKEMIVSLPTKIRKPNDEQTKNNESRRVARCLSWREANERARILFYRGKHPAIHYDEKTAAFDVRMLLETASGETKEVPVTDTDIHELLNSCGVQWDGVNMISLLDHSEDVVRQAENAALKVIREKGLVDLRTASKTTENEKI